MTMFFTFKTRQIIGNCHIRFCLKKNMCVNLFVAISIIKNKHQWCFDIMDVLKRIVSSEIYFLLTDELLLLLGEHLINMF